MVIYFTIGTRIIYERKFLLQMQNSPLSRSPPKNMPSIPGVTLMKSSLSSPPISTSPQPPKVMSPAKKESDTALRQEGNFYGKSIACSNNVCTNVSVPYCMCGWVWEQLALCTWKLQSILLLDRYTCFTQIKQWYMVRSGFSNGWFLVLSNVYWLGGD